MGYFWPSRVQNNVIWALFVHILGWGQNRWGFSDRQGFKIMLLGRWYSRFRTNRWGMSDCQGFKVKLFGRCLSIFSGLGPNRWGISDPQGFKIISFGRCLSKFSDRWVPNGWNISDRQVFKVILLMRCLSKFHYCCGPNRSRWFFSDCQGFKII